MNWNSNALKEIEIELGKRIERCAIHIVNKIKVKINRSQPYTIGKGKGKYYHGLDPSKPGDPPKKIRGDLLRSISYEMSADKQTAKIGTNLAYGAYLELGTSKMEPRPFLRSTIIEEEKAIDKILGNA